jgi:hypothetical protein
MDERHQFTLGYLFWEIFWIAATLACLTQMFDVPTWAQIVLNLLGTICVCAAIGGLFGKMANGFWVGVAVTVSIGLLLAPLLYHQTATADASRHWPSRAADRIEWTA